MFVLIIENHIGKITISEKFLSDLIGYTITNCFGVADMNSSRPIDTLYALFKKKNKDNKISKGVKVTSKDNKLIVDLHITVAFGTNISVVTKSISDKVQFAVEEATGMEVSKVNVFIDNMNV